MSGQGQTLPAAKVPASITCLTGGSATHTGDRQAFPKPRLPGKTRNQVGVIGNDLMNRRLTGQPLKVSFVIY